MPTIRPTLLTKHYYHVYNRGTDKRKIFMDERDRYRFIHDLFEFNDERNVENLFRMTNDEKLLYRLPQRQRKPRKLLVDIVAFAMMPNHYHLLLRQRIDQGISLFMQKLGGGYTGYFNERHERSGVLFQGKFKLKHVSSDTYLRHLVAYIHANPLPLLKSDKKIDTYRWSSYIDYLGEQKNFPSLVNWNIVDELSLPIGDAQRKLVAGLKDRTYDPTIGKLIYEE